MPATAIPREIADLDHWDAALKSVCGPFQTRPGDHRSFSGRIGLSRIGELDVAEIHAPGCRIVKPKAALERSPDYYLFLILQTRGEAMLAQDGNEAMLRAGDFTFIDSRASSDFTLGQGDAQISCHLPWPLVKDRLGERAMTRARRFDGGRDTGALVSAYIRHIHSLRASLDDAGGEAAVDALFAMLHRLLHPGAQEDRPALRADLARVQRFIDAHLANPELDVDMLAEAHNMSRRSLYRLFSQIGTSPAGWIWERRLTRARALLSDPGAAGMHITAVAYDCGFNDSAHFTRRFKARFGVSPSSYRVM